MTENLGGEEWKKIVMITVYKINNEGESTEEGCDRKRAENDRESKEKKEEEAFEPIETRADERKTKQSTCALSEFEYPFFTNWEASCTEEWLYKASLQQLPYLPL
ncbi:predicted protein [Histoplasma mississippiense (nom. inval.)]|uniref:predicted protein n=1 Tax=Ajellomyces capsulatus (strain NAm1 / WU24) TaxID=2059318 RepID=UPI000157C311|nr:predicted protein [Histoplasma mississippiense (nom. inval.)]EDN07666.1 predicted protein [Histoplasma mississippiense (nom. inval.)]